MSDYLVPAIAELKRRRAALSEAIAGLEKVRALYEGNGTLSAAIAEPASRPGRKYMSAEERIAVSERMMKFWAAKKGKGGSE